MRSFAAILAFLLALVAWAEPVRVSATEDERLVLAWSESCASCRDPVSVHLTVVEAWSNHDAVPSSRRFPGRRPTLAAGTAAAPAVLAWEEGPLVDGGRRRLFVTDLGGTGDEISSPRRIDDEPLSLRLRGLEARRFPGPVLAVGSGGRRAVISHHRSSRGCLDFDLGLYLEDGRGGTEVVEIASGPLDELDAAAAFDDEGRLLVVWSEILGLARHEESRRLMARVVGPDGELDEPFELLGASSAPLSTPAVVADGEGWAIATNRRGRVLFMRVDAGASIRRRALPTARPDSSLALARDPEDRLILAWRESATPSRSKIRAAILHPDRYPLAEAVTVVFAGTSAGAPSLAVGRGRVNLVWLEDLPGGAGRRAFVRLLSEDLETLDPPSLARRDPLELASSASTDNAAIAELGRRLLEGRPAERVEAVAALQLLDCDLDPGSQIAIALERIRGERREDPLLRLEVFDHLELRGGSGELLLELLDDPPLHRWQIEALLDLFARRESPLDLGPEAVAGFPEDRLEEAVVALVSRGAAVAPRCRLRTDDDGRDRRECHSALSLLDAEQLLEVLEARPDLDLARAWEGEGRRLDIRHWRKVAKGPDNVGLLEVQAYLELESEEAAVRARALRFLSWLGPQALEASVLARVPEIREPNEELAAAAVHAREMVRSVCLDAAAEGWW